MNNLRDYLDKKLQELDVDRAGDLVVIQKQLDAWYPGKARAKSLNNGKLVITTMSSSVAGELRFKQEQLKVLNEAIEKVIIR